MLAARPPKPLRITGTLHEDQLTFLIIFPSVLPEIKNISEKSCYVIRTLPVLFISKFCPTRFSVNYDFPVPNAFPHVVRTLTNR
jgi:hypothetical protein